MSYSGTPEERRAKKRAYQRANRDKKRADDRRYAAKHAEELRVRKQAYYLENRTRLAEQSHTRYEENKEAIQARSKAYYWANRDLMHVRKLRYYATHGEELRAKQRAYRLAHLEEDKAKKLADYHANKEKHAAKHKAYYLINQQAIKAQSKARYQQLRARMENDEAFHRAWRIERNLKLQAWRESNPESALLQVESRRARKLNAPVNDLTPAQWQEIKEAFNHRCAYCGRTMQRLTQDHITPLSKGGSHTYSNVVPACQSCNSHKHTGLPLVPVQPLLLTIAPAKKKRRAA